MGKKIKLIVGALFAAIILGGASVGLHALMYGGDTNCAGTPLEVGSVTSCAVDDANDIITAVFQ